MVHSVDRVSEERAFSWGRYFAAVPRRRAWSALIPALLLALAGTAGCAGSGMAPSATVTTAVQGWEHYFRLEWAPQRTAAGTLIDGYIHNTYGSPAGHVRLLAQALDRDSNVIAQKIEWVPGIVPNFSRSYFRISALPPAEHYRVSVWSFDIIDTDDDFMRFPRYRD
jgi:hypothetical protein